MTERPISAFCKEKNMRGWLRRGRIHLVAWTFGGSVLVLQGCDPGVRDTVLGGVESAGTTLATTFIQAFFQSLTAPDDNNTTTGTTKVFDDPSNVPLA